MYATQIGVASLWSVCNPIKIIAIEAYETMQVLWSGDLLLLGVSYAVLDAQYPFWNLASLKNKH